MTPSQCLDTSDVSWNHFSKSQSVSVKNEKKKTYSTNHFNFLLTSILTQGWCRVLPLLIWRYYFSLMSPLSTYCPPLLFIRDTTVPPSSIEKIMIPSEGDTWSQRTRKDHQYLPAASSLSKKTRKKKQKTASPRRNFESCKEAETMRKQHHKKERGRDQQLSRAEQIDFLFHMLLLPQLVDLKTLSIWTSRISPVFLDFITASMNISLSYKFVKIFKSLIRWSHSSMIGAYALKIQVSPDRQYTWNNSILFTFRKSYYPPLVAHQNLQCSFFLLLFILFSDTRNEIFQRKRP